MLVVGSLHDARERHRIAHRNCVAIEQLKGYLREQADRSLKTLPTLAYYRQHVDELKEQLVEINRRLQSFAPKPCP